MRKRKLFAAALCSSLLISSIPQSVFAEQESPEAAGFIAGHPSLNSGDFLSVLQAGQAYLLLSPSAMYEVDQTLLALYGLDMYSLACNAVLIGNSTIMDDGTFGYFSSLCASLEGWGLPQAVRLLPVQPEEPPVIEEPAVPQTGDAAGSEQNPDSPAEEPTEAEKLDPSTKEEETAEPSDKTPSAETEETGSKPSESTDPDSKPEDGSDKDTGKEEVKDENAADKDDLETVPEKEGSETDPEKKPEDPAAESAKDPAETKEEEKVAVLGSNGVSLENKEPVNTVLGSSLNVLPVTGTNFVFSTLQHGVNRKIEIKGLGRFDLLPDYTNNAAWKGSSSSYNTPYLWGQCTWFAWGRFYELYGFNPGFTGNGNLCASQLVNAHPDKFELSSLPKSGAVFSGDMSHNHVGIVLEYDETTGLMTVQEGNLDGVSNMNWNVAIADYRTIEVSLDQLRSMYGNVRFANPKDSYFKTVTRQKRSLREIAIERLRSFQPEADPAKDNEEPSEDLPADSSEEQEQSDTQTDSLNARNSQSLML